MRKKVIELIIGLGSFYGGIAWIFSLAGWEMALAVFLVSCGLKLDMRTTNK